MIARRSLPRFVELGVTQTLSLDVYSDGGDQQTFTAGTVTVYLGSTPLVDGLAFTSGAPATYSLLGTVHEDEAPSDQYLEVWTGTIGGTPYTFRVPGYLVRHAYIPSITDTDLTDRHNELSTFSTALGGYQRFRDEANVMLQLDLLERGNRPWLVFDAFVLRRLHILLTLHLLFRDFMSTVGDGKYERLAKDYGEQYRDARGTANFRYDHGETGTIDNQAQTAASSPVFVTAGPRRSLGVYR